LRPALRGRRSALGGAVGQFPPDLLHGRADHDGDAPVAQLGGPLLARVFIISNRVAVPTPERGVHPGGLEVALRATLRDHPCVWLGWSGDVKPEAQTKTRTIAMNGMT